MAQDVIQAIESNIKEARKIAEVGTALERLQSNRDFKKVVLEGYFEQEAVRLVHLKAEPAMQKPEMQQSILTQMDAIGSFAQYLDTVLHKASLATKAIASDEETRDEILAEELSRG